MGVKKAMGGEAMTYNGWKNRETWLVFIWYNPESRADLLYAREDLERQVEELPNGPLRDMIDLSLIDWRELEEAMDEEDEEIEE
jgi:hypothetical protein